MREAVGNSTVLVIIVFFTVVVLGYLAFNVNYTKAFRMKNKIISLFEEYEGNCQTECLDKMYDFSREIAYSLDVGTSDSECPSDGFIPLVHNGRTLGCYKEVPADENPDILADDIRPRRYYIIVTAINIKIPIISNILAYGVFRISGSTQAFAY